MALAVILLALVLGLSSGRWLISVGYATYAEEQLRTGWHDAAVAAAAAFAVRLSTNGTREKALQARLFAEEGRYDAALEQYRAVLKLAAADPVYWHEFIKAKVGAGQYDAETEHALQRVRALAPKVLGLHRSNAALGLRYWPWATPAVRDIWLGSIRYLRLYDATGLRKTVLTERREETFCEGPAKQLEVSVQEWCKHAHFARRACFAPGLTPEAVRWCRDLGYAEETLQ